MIKIFYFVILYILTTGDYAYTDQSPLMNRPYQTLKNRLPPLVVAAHQGQIFGNGWMNSLSAFEEAYQDGADVIEFDLRLTKDKIPIVYHDEDLKTWTACTGKVSDFTAAAIQKNCRFKFSNQWRHQNEYPPLFEDVVKWSKGKIILDGEFKDIGAIDPTIKIVQKYRAHAWTYFQTKASHERYQLARQIDQEIVLLYNIRDYEDLSWALSLNDPALLIIELHEKTRSPKFLDLIHRSDKLASENSWHFNFHYEFFGASCDEVFKHHIDIAVSNRPRDCVRQRHHLLR